MFIILKLFRFCQHYEGKMKIIRSYEKYKRKKSESGWKYETLLWFIKKSLTLLKSMKKKNYCGLILLEVIIALLENLVKIHFF